MMLGTGAKITVPYRGDNDGDCHAWYIQIFAPLGSHLPNDIKSGVLYIQKKSRKTERQRT